MHGNAMIGIGGIIILGIFAQWLGWRAKLPAILPLLIIGLMAGPVTGLINPDHLLGDLLFPMVSSLAQLTTGVLMRLMKTSRTVRG